MCALVAGGNITKLLGLEAAVGAQLGAAACFVLGSGRCLLDTMRRTPAVRRKLDAESRGSPSRHAACQVQALCQLNRVFSSEQLAGVHAQAFAPERAVPWLVALVDCLLALMADPAGRLLPH